ncbi:MAG: DNA polymerase III subunit epsilon [Gammaproteobacteria bacterium]|nr:DNA polymerase III subunit epsilon [Gammaproteobacteria bacterium]
MRQIVLDTETTGLDPAEGHAIIEIGAIELVNRRITNADLFHEYINPRRAIDAAAVEVHGITSEMLADKPVFADIVERFLEAVQGAELLIHNAPFDVGFLNAEIRRVWESGRTLPVRQIEECCQIVDTLQLARQLHPGQKNSLDALCKRYGIDNSHRIQHGARLDAIILADVYLAMTGGQTTLFADTVESFEPLTLDVRGWQAGEPLVIRASAEELAAHEACLQDIDKKSAGRCLWKVLQGDA